MAKIEIENLELKHKGWSTFSVAHVRLPGGEIIQREIEDHGSAVAVLPYDPVRRTAILVEQFRPAPFLIAGQARTLEAIAGVIEEAEAQAAARREALEEGGLALHSLACVATAWTMPGISTERLTLYLAEYRPEDRVALGGGVASEHEDITVVEMSLDQLAARMAAGDIVDLKTLTLTQALQLRRPDLFVP